MCAQQAGSPDTCSSRVDQPNAALPIRLLYATISRPVELSYDSIAIALRGGHLLADDITDPESQVHAGAELRVRVHRASARYTTWARPPAETVHPRNRIYPLQPP